MSGKSRRKKGKHLPKSRKRKSGQHFLTTTAQQAVAPTHEPVSRPDVSAPLASEPTSVAKPAAVRYPYVVTELRMIGILAGIILVILIILALVLS